MDDPLTGATPRRLFQPERARERLAFAAGLRERIATTALSCITGYSIKTNPRTEMLAMAREHGFYAEAISRDELRWAAACGFAPQQTIYNGPEPLDTSFAGRGLAYVYADSVEAFARNARLIPSPVAGARLRPSMIGSRFGIPVGEEDALLAAIASLAPGTPLAFSFHARHQDFHGASWRDVAGDVLVRAADYGRRAGRPVVAFDVGGGWEPSAFDAQFGDDMLWLTAAIARELPACRAVLAEPGQAMTTPVESLVTQIVEVRRRPSHCEVIVDAGYPDWPEMHGYVHPIAIARGDAWQPLGRGPDRLGGRTCLEYDVLDGLRFPDDVREGDRLLIAGVGSYDRSMAFDFAHGGHGDGTLL